MGYYSYVQIYVLGQKIDGHEMSDSLSVLYSTLPYGTIFELCVLADFLWIIRALDTWHFFPVENVPCSTGWTFEPYACFCIAIAAAFPWFWGLVELDLSPRDSPKGLCNISRDQKGWYCRHTSRPKMSDISGSKVDFNLYLEMKLVINPPSETCL